MIFSNAAVAVTAAPPQTHAIAKEGTATDNLHRATSFTASVIWANAVARAEATAAVTIAEQSQTFVLRRVTVVQDSLARVSNATHWSMIPTHQFSSTSVATGLL